MSARFLIFASVATHKLKNYLRTYRKRTGLSQAEVAFLLGASDSANFCRYEAFLRDPSLQTALACEAIFRVPIRDLFGGMYEEAEQEVLERARRLSEKLGSSDPAPPRHRARR